MVKNQCFEIILLIFTQRTRKNTFVKNKIKLLLLFSSFSIFFSLCFKNYVFPHDEQTLLWKIEFNFNELKKKEASKVNEKQLICEKISWNSPNAWKQFFFNN